MNLSAEVDQPKKRQDRATRHGEADDRGQGSWDCGHVEAAQTHRQMSVAPGPEKEGGTAENDQSQPDDTNEPVRVGVD